MIELAKYTLRARDSQNTDAACPPSHARDALLTDESCDTKTRHHSFFMKTKPFLL